MKEHYSRSTLIKSLSLNEPPTKFHTIISRDFYLLKHHSPKRMIKNIIKICQTYHLDFAIP